MDPLTGLGGRDDFLAWLRKTGVSVCGIYLDIDAFNGVSAVFGHVEGDRVLTELGGWLSRKARSLGLDAFRIGGDDFVLIGTAMTGDQARALAAGIVRDSQTLGLPYGHPLKTRTQFSLSAAVFRASSADRGEFKAALDQLGNGGGNASHSMGH